ncbi:helix-turn-helix domain-containing protein [Amycolatopsis saalfeldensis]|uniref:Transcriptional regulator, contains XRE-family HTH domain n=1 Tax=Amycolatopsis saalfeldensis TaxID=394193 RepID=A0A1H8Y369_9PSEU|nr:helix-turn-helix domain-containing protein [Amycolatopsis saalfeldensis]SEP46507.1 Transcriptional regulator, contains XRE-family HTH domain [Amycolatopsis saalfeldensis]
MAFGDLIRDLRSARGWSQDDLARALSDRAQPASLTREEVSRWENGKRTPRRFWLGHLAAVLDTPLATLEREKSPVRRREFLLGASTLALNESADDSEARTAASIAECIASGDGHPLATVQTTHKTDLIIWLLVQTDRVSMLHLRHWLTDGATPILRVNAAGILAKSHDENAVDAVAAALERDTETRALYRTAVAARVLHLPWGQAADFEPSRANPRQIAALARELGNRRDAGARWCSASMLGQVAFRHPAAATALTSALHTEPSRETLRHIALATTEGIQ